MSKRLIVVLALAFVVGIAFAAYAEVQNVKVSGDLTVKGVARNNLDLKKATPHSGEPGAVSGEDDLGSVLSIVRVRVDADLTDNVSTTVRLLNEREWGTNSTAANDDIDLDLAYATMKEFLYSPLTVTLGRQELHFGNDMIIGDPDTNGVATGTALPLNLQDLSARKAFDAVRATLDYNPLVVDLIYAKITEGTNTLNDDTTLSGINANYALNKETTLEGYGFTKTKDSNATKSVTILNNDADRVYTVGGRVKNSSIKNLTAQIESAFQFGTYNPAFDINATTNAKTSKRRAWALEALATYDLKDIAKIAKYSPSLTGAYVYLSGDNPEQKTDDKTWTGWDSMFENQTFGHLINAIMGFTNTQIVGLSGKIKPADDVTLNLDYVYLWLNKAYRSDNTNLKGVSGANTYTMTHNKNLGQEIDAKLIYDYTEDVQLSLLGGLFLPGNAFEKDTAGNRSIASEVIGSMKVTF